MDLRGFIGYYILYNPHKKESIEALIDKYHRIITGACWSAFTLSKDISMAFIKSRPEYQWDEYALILRPDYPIDELEEKINNPKYQRYIIRSPRVPWTFIIEHPEIKWFMHGISMYCIDLTPQIVLSCRHIQWDLYSLLHNREFKENSK
jgi:hypothetical protein